MTAAHEQHICVCMCVFCLLTSSVFRQSLAQHFLFHLHERMHTHTRSSALMWCDSTVILAVLTLWACLSLSLFLPPTSLAYDHRVVYIKCCLQQCLFVCVFGVHVCLPFYHAVFPRVRSWSHTKDKTPSLIHSKISSQHTQTQTLHHCALLTTNPNPLLHSCACWICSLVHSSTYLN